jgi:hypothetical protein
MTSDKQIEANQRNAKKSTGPVTEEGKAKVARNAVSHGLTALTLAPGETGWDDLVLLRERFHASYQPADEIEAYLVERIAIYTWQRRMVSKSSEGLLYLLTLDPKLARKSALGDEYRKAPKNLDALTRYEASIDHALTEAMDRLEALQAARRENENYKTKPIVPEESEAGAENEANSAAMKTS